MRQARWYVDADTIGLGRVLASARLRVNWPGDTGVRPNGRDRVNASPITDTAVPDKRYRSAKKRAFQRARLYPNCRVCH